MNVKVFIELTGLCISTLVMYKIRTVSVFAKGNRSLPYNPFSDKHYVGCLL